MAFNKSFISTLFSLEGKVALVTGASRGIGKAIAENFALAGAKVVGIARSFPSTENPGKGEKGIVQLHCDVTRRKQILQVVNYTVETFGTIDILVNNAGIIKRHPALEYPSESWEEVIKTNLNAAFQLSQEVGRHFIKKRHGKIINIASLLSFSGGINVAAYSASKGAIAQMTKALANEWAAMGIQVNAIAPGYIKTENTEPLYQDPQRYQEILSRIPAGRWGMPEDLVGTAIFLASPASNYINGHILVVDGGWMAR